MLERLPLSYATRHDPRDTALTAFSLLLHASVAATLILISWLSLPAVSLPRLRPVLVTPIQFFPLAGRPAPKLGSRDAIPVRRPERKPPVSPSDALIPPREIPPLSPEPSAEGAPAPDAESLSGSGDPEGVPEGDPQGKKGGICVGEGCDPDGPAGLGPGVRDGPGGEEGDEIRYPGIGDVTEPILIESSRVLPRYPELARRAGVRGRVILEAVIQSDGSVASVRILSESPPGLGFGPAAADAVTRWRYLPGSHEGRPVAVYFSVVVEFTLSR